MPSDLASHALRSRPVAAVLVMVAAAAVLQQIPLLKRFHLLGNNEPAPTQRPSSHAQAAIVTVGESKLAEESDNQGERTTPSAGATRVGVIPSEKVDSSQVDVNAEKPPPVPLEDDENRGMAHFYSSLRETASRRANGITRIVHFGDSLVASDYVSSTLRRLLQAQFGDAGHGFTLVANAWPSYFHEGVTRFATSGWLVSRVVGPYIADGWYGLGGVSFKAPPNTLARIGTAKRGDFGRQVSRFELAYVASPDGGTIRVRIDAKDVEELSTRNPEKQFKTSEWKVPEGAHELELLTTRGTSRLFGVVLERDEPGVVLDAIGIQGARLRFLDQQDDAHYAEQLRWRKPDLVVYEFGANESADGLAYSLDDFHSTMKAVLVQQKAAVPEASCLVVGAMDRAIRKGDTVTSSFFIPMLVKEQRAVAKEVGCAFFDTFQAMGGNGSMPRWFKKGLGQADLTHPTAVGADIIGTWLYRAMMGKMH